MARLTRWLKREAARITQWRALDEHYAVGEFSLQLLGWLRPRRFVVIREQLRAVGSTRLRIGEAAGLEIQDVSPDASTIRIRQSVWNVQKQAQKTHIALREIDLHPSLAAMLKAFIGEREAGLLFQTKNGRPLLQSNIIRRSLHPILKKTGRAKAGFHSFRRYRVTHLRKNRVPEDLLRFWIGHAGKSVADGYSMVKSDVAFRQLCAANVGLGFELPATDSIENSAVAPIASCYRVLRKVH